MLCVLCIIARSSPAGNEYPVATWKLKNPVDVLFFILISSYLTSYIMVGNQH